MQYPNFFGGIEDIAAIADLAHARGGALVVSTYPVPLGLLQPPGDLGADVVAAEGQALGVPQGYGGPYVGLLASRQSYVRQMPGRLAGMTTRYGGQAWVCADACRRANSTSGERRRPPISAQIKG